MELGISFYRRNLPSHLHDERFVQHLKDEVDRKLPDLVELAGPKATVETVRRMLHELLGRHTMSNSGLWNDKQALIRHQLAYSTDEFPGYGYLFEPYSLSGGGISERSSIKHNQAERRSRAFLSQASKKEKRELLQGALLNDCSILTTREFIQCRMSEALSAHHHVLFGQASTAEGTSSPEQNAVRSGTITPGDLAPAREIDTAKRGSIRHIS